jgi:hypothetical protein
MDWIDFGSKNLTLSNGSAINTRQTLTQVKVGLNYRLQP